VVFMMLLLARGADGSWFAAAHVGQDDEAVVAGLLAYRRSTSSSGRDLRFGGTAAAARLVTTGVISTGCRDTA
jgi:hypothetical protein